MDAPIPFFMHRPSAGFSLVEVLVTLLLLGIGLLGAQQMQANALRQQREDQWQASASHLAAELAERMRSYPDMALRADSPYWQDLTLDAQGPALPQPDCMRHPCMSPEQSATREFAEWQRQVAQQLPDARVQVCPGSSGLDAEDHADWECNPSTSPGLVTIKLGWHTPGDNADHPRTVLVFSPGIANGGEP